MHLLIALGVSFAALVSLLLLTLLLRYNLTHLRLCRSRRRDVEATPAAEAEEEPAKSDSGGIRRYGWNEIESLTSNFTAPVVGQGGFSIVYLASLEDPSSSSLAAVKVHRSGGGERLHRCFRLELDLLRRLRHPHIVSLLGFCDSREEDGVLVLEYVPGGNLHQKLHGGGTPLTWPARMRILYEVSGAVEYLHNSSGEVPIVHGDLTAANVLLDDRLGVKLCDFGSARVGFSAAVSRSAACSAIGSPGYADPHYLRTGVVSKNSDVYSFGVLVLETITGLPAVGSEEGKYLTAEMAPRLAEMGKGVGEVVDLKLGGEFDAGEVAEMAAVAARCVGPQPSLRPSMGEIRGIMRERVRSVMSTVGEGSDGKGKS
ncbi:salt tolerance receptor-like cytoplasmic kinase 1 [Typha latifolia]|uniref:salt tolerance receptor-like cytoplasmic kinase 1 n=1 Tax=Typha latifolia TaxID=4733 RepID=UPI003C2C44C8